MSYPRQAGRVLCSVLVSASIVLVLGGCAASKTAPASREADALTKVTATATPGAPGGATVASAPTASATGASSTPKPTPVSSAELIDRITAALGDDAENVSVTVHNRKTGVTTRVNPSLNNCTGSIVKVMILVATIRERRAEGRPLSTSQRMLATQMIRYSDNDAAETLFQQVGGVRGLSDVAEDFGMTRTEPAWAWGRTTTTASDQARLMDLIVGGTPLLGGSDRAYILGLMDSVVDEQSWGVGTVPAGVKAQVKNGWVDLSPRGWRVNSIGHVVGQGRDYTVAMLSYDNATMDHGIDLLDSVSSVVYDASAA